ncbi:sensor histidine kinase [Hymenobacter sp. 102]|uniref:sensor histidine kinase n=1 Tax=Hymenobacter sp. 102 TaxID=3403152 RepID=UPI003CF1E2E8
MHSTSASFPPTRIGWPWLVLRDAFIWGLLLLLLWRTLPLVPNGNLAQLQHAVLVTVGLSMVAVYGNNLGLVPTLFDRGRYGWYALALLGWTLLLHMAGRLLWPEVHAAAHQPAVNCLFTMLIAMGLLLIWRSVAQHRQRLRRQLLEREQQLRLLEAQVNPHFLFNTLNSLYALSLTQSPQTPDMLLALSGLMRYQLESTRRAQVPLQEELDYLRSYVQLQELRLGPRCPVQLRLPPEEVAASLTVAPLLFLALIENAFTYGTRRASGSFVEISLTLNGQQLHLALRNALPPPTDAGGGTGTGLSNTRQRLALLYPGRHHLHAAPTPDQSAFLTQLTLSL